MANIANIESLPDEIVACIARYTPSGFLPALAKVSKQFNRCSTPLLYQYVHLWESGDDQGIILNKSRINKSRIVPNIPDWTHKHLRWCGSNELGREPHYDQRIFHLDAFLRTISENETLRSLVVGASFESRLPSHDEDIDKITWFLSSSLKHLHCTRTLDDHDLWNEHLITSLEVERLAGRRDEEWADSIDEKLRSLFFHRPNLRMLTLVGIASWEPLAGKPESEFFPKTSNITSLALRDCIGARAGLNVLIGWIKALKSLHYEMKQDSKRQYCYARGIGWALESQHDTLEELFVYGEMSRCWVCGAKQLEGIKSCSRLSNLGIPFHLIPRKIFFEEGEDEGPPINELLPPALVNLQLELPDFWERKSYFSTDEPDSDDIDESALGLFPMEFGDILLTIVSNKKKCYPGLQEIVLWQKGKRLPAGVQVLQGEDKGCKELVELCRRERIQISWVTGEFPPLVGA